VLAIDSGANRHQRREIADGSGESTQHAKLGASVAIVGVESVSDEAAITGLAAEKRHLSLELLGGGGDQRNAEADRCVADRQPRREIVGAVDDQVVAVEDRVRIVGIDPVCDRADVDVGIALAGKSCGQIRFALANLVGGIDRLALKVGKFDSVVVDNGQMANACADQR